MCYHTTYLFSLCGHTSVSSQPIRDTQPCPESDKSEDNETALVQVPLRSSIDLLSSFPSPQEFEFAKVLHHSLPASPVSLLRTKQDSGNHTHTFIAPYETVTNPAKTRKVSISTKTDNISVRCPTIKRHPLHTFLIPDLCRLCRQTREYNMAKFEAEAIKDSLEMALTGRSRGGKGSHSQDASSVINDERRKITAPRGKKGTIPLILSAVYARQDGERRGTNAGGRTSGEAQFGFENINNHNSSSKSPAAEAVSTDAAVVIASTSKTAPASQTPLETREDPNPRNSHSRDASRLSAGTGPSWWRWRKPVTNTAGLVAVFASTGEASPPSPHSGNKSSVKTDKHRRSSSTLSSPSSSSGPSRLSWRGKYEQDVQRDGLGRSTKGMDRIMRWSNHEGDPSNDK